MAERACGDAGSRCTHWVHPPPKTAGVASSYTPPNRNTGGRKDLSRCRQQVYPPGTPTTENSRCAHWLHPAKQKYRWPKGREPMPAAGVPTGHTPAKQKYRWPKGREPMPAAGVPPWYTHHRKQQVCPLDTPTEQKYRWSKGPEQMPAAGVPPWYTHHRKQQV